MTAAAVVVQAPEHVIENLKLAEKSARDGKKTVNASHGKEFRCNWDKNTFLRLIAAPPERLTSLSRSRTGCC